MAADSTELTFVRCPSCRSLVPAVSKMCRMCGAALDVAARSEDSSEPRRSGRVRQRTMSAHAEELSSAVSKIREESSGLAPEPVSFEEPDGAVSDDPLSAYIQEVEVGDDLAAAEDPLLAAALEDTAADEQPPSGAPDADLYREVEHPSRDATELADASDPFDDLDDIRVEPQVEEAFTSELLDSSDFGTDPDRATSALEPHEGADVRQQIERQPGATLPREKGPKPRVIVESGGKRSKGALSFSKNPREQNKQARNGHSAKDHRQGEKQDNTRQPAQRPQRHEQKRHEVQRRTEPRREPPPVTVKPEIEESWDNFVPELDEPTPAPQGSAREQKGHRQHDRRHEAVAEEVRPSHKTPEARVPEHNAPEAVQSEELLVGWLIPLGDVATPVALHAGRFFVTRRSLKPGDLILDDDSVSSPHAIVAVGLKNGLRVQDLMSEHGMSVRRRHEEQWEQVADPVALSHGDSVRFGRCEYLVCMIPYPESV